MTTLSPSAIHRVIVTNMAFNPASIQIKDGEIVEWVFEDGNTQHNVTGSPSPARLRAAGVYSVTFSSLGTFTYHDSHHPQMTGKVVVVKWASDRVGGSDRTVFSAARRHC